MRKIFYSFLIYCFIFTIFSCGKTTEENVNDTVSKTNDNVVGGTGTGDAGSGGSLVEAAIDDFSLEFVTDGSGILGDVNNDNIINVQDIIILLNLILKASIGEQHHFLLKPTDPH